MLEFPYKLKSQSSWGSIRLHDPNKPGQGSTVMVRLQEDEQGFTHLTCECQLFQRKYWCTHVEQVYTEDKHLADLIHPTAVKDWTPAIVVFRLPSFLIIPTVRVPLEHNHLHRVDVLWGDAKVYTPVTNDGSMSIEAKGGETVGYLHPNHQRKTIRTAILEWLPQLWYMTDRKCPSNMHSQMDSVLDKYDELPDAEMDKRRAYIDLYSILDSSMCHACWRASQVPF